eukprot:4206510-Pleurochrysis_carterae.AAC.1
MYAIYTEAGSRASLSNHSFCWQAHAYPATRKRYCRNRERTGQHARTQLRAHKKRPTHALAAAQTAAPAPARPGVHAQTVPTTARARIL